MKKYLCHKTVHAAKIFSIQQYPGEYGVLCFFDPETMKETELHRTAEWMLRHKPSPGGYFVRYEDGYESYSPAATFESGYTEVIP